MLLQRASLGGKILSLNHVHVEGGRETKQELLLLGEKKNSRVSSRIGSWEVKADVGMTLSPDFLMHKASGNGDRDPSFSQKNPWNSQKPRWVTVPIDLLSHGHNPKNSQ